MSQGANAAAMGDTAQPRSLRDTLRSVFERARIPTNPTIAMEILRLADDPGSSAEQFAAVIASDPALAARLLEMANTAMYAQREPVTTIKRAVTLLGLRRIRMVALGFQLVAHLDRLGGANFDLWEFWRQSVLRACLAREISARVVPSCAEEAFLVGLLQDCGILVLVQAFGRDYASLYGSGLSPTAFFIAERGRFAHDHVQAIAELAWEWRLPDAIAIPLARHHERFVPKPDSTGIERLCAVAHFVGSLPLAAGLRRAPSEPALREYAREQLGLDEAAIAESLHRAGESYREVAALLADRVPPDLDVTTLLDEANNHLRQAATDAERRAEVIEAERDHIRRQQEQLKSALGQYRERAARDPLTRLLNRGALLEAALACMRECRDRNLALAVYFLDIDDFKVINDEFGHHVGDEVLRDLAGVIGEAVANGGFAGRYGGEEFIVVIPALDEDEARRRALQLVERVRQATPGAISVRTVTCSIGALWGRPSPGTSPHDLFAAADALMYDAKQGGKDRCSFKSLAAPGTIRVLVPGAPVESTAVPAADAGEAGERHVSNDEFRHTASELNRTEPRRYATMRKRERHELLAPCVLRCFASGAPPLRTTPGYLRNISTGGVGVLTTRPMVRGEPVEVEIEPGEGSTQLYIGGLVAFCRHVRDGIYEVGVQLVAQAREPIFSRNAMSRQDHLDWVAEVLRPGSEWVRYKRSA